MKGLSLERKISLIVLLTALPIFFICMLMLLTSDASALLVITVTLVLVISLVTGLVYTEKLLHRQLTSVTNVIESLRNGDFTSKLSTKDTDSAWGELQIEINRLAETLHKQRISSIESDIILDKLIEEFDIPLLVIDRSDALININAAGLALFNKPKQELVGLSHQQLHLSPLAEAEPGSLVEFTFPKRGGRWEVRRNVFRKGGSRLTLLLLNDLSRTLREQERQAWQRMIRVISHELNNSLASIVSIADTMQQNVSSLPEEKVKKAMGVITTQGRALQKFTESYTRLAKLPDPNLSRIEIGKVIGNCCDIVGGEFKINKEKLWLRADSSQLQQLLINLLKNAREASPENSPVEVSWSNSYYGVQINIVDSGCGISNSDNLFVPFYTTKEDGNGIGLYLCKQIAENHNGTLTLGNRLDAKGCIASLWLPMDN